MAMTQCRECKNDVSEWAKKCPHCGVETPDKDTFSINKTMTIVFGLLAAASVILFIVKTPLLIEGAKNVSAANYPSNDIFGDFGYKVKYSLKNIGLTGTIKVKVTLSCSTGTFQREEIVYFPNGETKEFVFDFPEPLVTSTDIKVEKECKFEKKE